MHRAVMRCGSIQVGRKAEACLAGAVIVVQSLENAPAGAPASLSSFRAWHTAELTVLSAPSWLGC
jgi:hypothetical protein